MGTIPGDGRDDERARLDRATVVTVAYELVVRAFALLCVVVLASGAAAADPAAPPPPRPCADDIARVCKGIAPGNGRLRVCLETHTSELSPRCREKLQASLVVGHLLPCRDDARAHCHGVQVGKGRLLECLESHRTDLTAQCRAALPPPRVPPPAPRRGPSFTPSPVYPST